MRLFFLLGISTIAIASVLDAQPRLSLKTLEVNLGTIYSGTSKKGRFEYKNTGKDTLRVNVFPTCGCTTIKPAKQFLLPKESDFVEFEFNSAGLTGKVFKYIRIESNDPTLPNTGIEFTANIVTELEPVDKRYSWWTNNLTVGQSTTETRKFVNASGHKLTIQGITTSAPSILQATTELRKLKSSDSIAITITLKAENLGFIQEHVFIQTDSKDQPRVDIPIHCQVVQENKQ